MRTRLKERVVFKCLVFTAIVFSAYYFVPGMVAEKPEIRELNPSQIMQNSQFNENESITLIGEGMNHITGIYVNGKWEPDCAILSQEPEKVEIILPAQYYETADELKIQVQVKKNSELFVKSNRKILTVLSDEDMEKPVIKSISPQTLQYDWSLRQRMEISGENFTEDSVVTIENETVDTAYEDGKLIVQVPFSTWRNTDKLKFRVKQYYDGYPTSIESNLFYYDTDVEEVSSEEEVYAANHEFILNYLSALMNPDYLILISARDEASCAMTEEIVNKLHELGLQEDLRADGPHSSYLAVIDGMQVVCESMSKNFLNYSYEFEEHVVYLASANMNVGNMSAIQIDGTEYSVNGRGLNIVVYDVEEQQVVDSVCFDTYSGLGLTKQNLTY